MSSNGVLAVCFIVLLIIWAFGAIYTAVGKFLNAGYAAHENRMHNK